MAEKKRALGKGLSALLKNPDTDITSAESIENSTKIVGSISELPLNQIEVNPFQPRTDFDEDALQELAISIKELGVIQPITVRKLGYDKFQLIPYIRKDTNLSVDDCWDYFRDVVGPFNPRPSETQRNDLTTFLN